MEQEKSDLEIFDKRFMEKTFTELYDIIKTLIAPDGCPWDSVQTPDSMKRYLVEETFEAVEAINEKNAEHIKEELGDVILNAVQIAALCEKQGLFSVEDVIKGASEKMIRRHPHVFENRNMTLEQLHGQWDRIKAGEGKTKKLTRPEKYAAIQKLLSSLAPDFDVK